MVKTGSIVRRVGTKEIYEVISIVGSVLMCKSVNVPALKKIEHNIPLQESEVEIMIDGETDAFDILFGEEFGEEDDFS